MPLSAPAARLYGGLCRLAAPEQVRTNRDTALIKLLACALMAIDHAGKMLFPGVPQLRYIGRLAFPMFAYCIAVGAVYTRSPVSLAHRGAGAYLPAALRAGPRP